MVLRSLVFSFCGLYFVFKSKLGLHALLTCVVLLGVLLYTSSKWITLVRGLFPLLGGHVGHVIENITVGDCGFLFVFIVMVCSVTILLMCLYIEVALLMCMQ